MTDLLPELRSLLAAQPSGSGAHATLEHAVAELAHLYRQRDDLQRRGTELITENRRLKAPTDGTAHVSCKRIGAADLQLPAYAKPGDSGLDIRADITWFARSTVGRGEDGRPFLGSVARWIADDEIELYRGERIAVGCGFAFETPPGTEWQVRPRSGHSLAGIDSILGTIDSRYRGEVVMIVINNSAWGAKIKHGMRLSQIVLAPVLHARLVEVAEIGSTERGMGGLGHTGVR